MQVCKHCSLQFHPKSPGELFCCSGCYFAADFLKHSGLTRFYDLRDGQGVAVGNQPYLSSALFDWADKLVRLDGDLSVLQVDVQGLHCAACVWLIEKVFQQESGSVRIWVNSSLGQMRLVFKAGFVVQEFLLKLAKLGYTTAAPGQQRHSESKHLILRFAICGALSMNSMVLSAAFYLGLTTLENPLIYPIFSWTNLLLSTLCLWVGGSVFFKSAAYALKQKIIHLDLPIALGLALGFIGSLISFFSVEQNAVYFDTLNIFVTLMLLGRILQSRIIGHNRSLLLNDNTLKNLTIRHIRNGLIQLSPAENLLERDEFLVVPGEVLPCSARLLDPEATCSLEWIQGESVPHPYKQEETLPAGAFNIGSRAFRCQALEDFGNSKLVKLLASPTENSSKNQVSNQLLPLLSKYYALGVLVIATVGFFLWLPIGFSSALGVCVALLVVTCPCAIGLATPLALDLTIVQLRTSGLYIRNTDFLTRLLKVRKIFFDKTGTLTLGELELANPDVLQKLDFKALDALYQMAARSNHPKSRAMAKHLQRQLDPNAIVFEQAGRGMVYEDWEFSGALRHRETIVAVFEFKEELKSDVTAQLEQLSQMQIDFYLLSGDTNSKVLELGKRLGIPPNQVWGALSPTEKAEKIIELDLRDTLMIGDGINDALAFDAAYCAGTPAVLHPTLPGRADFFFLGSGLGPLAETVVMARHLKSVIKRNIIFAFAYNVLAVSLAFVGVITPVFAAIFMPASSISIIAVTIWSFRRRAT